ncbi:hypothetical protein H0H81_008915 [Sphagnurus paluster]|uniref:Cytochrome P450 n=1 Tax=Sphagnurus paluster TaxID=117069 RepID=A0A9P7K4R9_9AGAR|nr:hypothetical protein H0H81_008915 [Sphagnurus paluster]
MGLPILLLAIPVAFLVFFLSRSSKKAAPLPPGPPAEPIIGHLRMIPPNGQDVFFYEMGKRYGDVVYLKALNRTLIILNTVEAATDLFDKRSTNYSDRPKIPFFELVGLGNSLPFLEYGREWRAQRKMVQNFFSKDKTKQHRPIQTREARVLVQNLLAKPEEYDKLIMRYGTAVIMDVGYGHRVVSNDDPYLKVVGDVSRASNGSAPPGGTIHLPSWFPGTFHAEYARSVRPVFDKLKQYPVAQVEEAMVRATPMVLFPEYQTVAQKELDTVVGTDRLPEFYDRERLPYLECLLQEVMRYVTLQNDCKEKSLMSSRWNQAAPTDPSGAAHGVQEDDIYNGMLIPKGSIVVANIRGMTLDERVYKDPFKFDPTRYMPAPEGRGEPWPTAAFGFGRRICPGRFLANDNVWIAMATILSTFTISKAIDTSGKPIIPEVSYAPVGVASSIPVYYGASQRLSPISSPADDRE